MNISYSWADRLLAWYYENRREMPWRGHPDPYAVWVSEIMLQQTQVDTVRPYFKRFLEAFPTIQALAEAADEPLLKAWEGLGYYTRVRNLRTAAQQVMREYAGELPKTFEGLQKLKGIGTYSAAAIASICFQQPEPVVDGNVARVFARRNERSDDFKKEAPRRVLAAWLRPAIEHTGHPGDFNQAMMELGALICTRAHPLCESCPLRPECLAQAHGTIADFPTVAPKAKLPTRKRTGLLVWSTQGSLLLQHHTGERLLEGFWELPEKETVPCAVTLTRQGLYKQTFSHFHLVMTLFRAEPVPECALPEGFCWAAAPADLPLTTATRKILAAQK